MKPYAWKVDTAQLYELFPLSTYGVPRLLSDVEEHDGVLCRETAAGLVEGTTIRKLEDMFLQVHATIRKRDFLSNKIVPLTRQHSLAAAVMLMFFVFFFCSLVMLYV